MRYRGLGRGGRARLHLRQMRRVVLISLILSRLTLAGPPSRPHVDSQAMREAMGAGGGRADNFPSAASYGHFLKARMAHHEGHHQVALDELRLAAASDDLNPYLMTGIAEQYARGAQLDRAETQLRRVLEHFPEYARAQLLMGRVLYENHKAGPARVHLAKAIRLRPSDPDAYLVLTQLWLDQGKVDDAVKVVEALGVALPGEPIGYRRLGLALVDRGETERGSVLLKRAVERDPGDVESWSALARIEEDAGAFDSALASWERALERDSENRELLVSAGRVALRAHHVAEAQAYFNQALAQGDDAELAVKVSVGYLAANQPALAAAVLDRARASGAEPRLHFYAGLVYERLGQLKQAVDAFEAVPEQLGDVSMQARLHRGMCLSLLGRHAPAVAVLKDVYRSQPQMSGVVAALARTLERAHRQQEAEALLVAALKQNPSSEVVEALSGFYSRANRLTEAAELFNSALARGLKSEAVLLALAQVYEKKGEWNRAVEHMRGLLNENPDNLVALNFVGYTLAQHGGDLDEAERLVRRALALRPESPAILDSLGWVLIKKGAHASGAEVLEQAVAQGPEDATLYEHLGEASLKLGRMDRAVECFARAVELLKENPDEAERPSQRVELERKLKFLSPEGKGR